jgi:hypothetical protein
MVNVLAGSVKRRIEGRASLTLGLPLFVNGVVQPNERIQISTAELKLGAVGAVVLLAWPRPATAVGELHSALEELRGEAAERNSVRARQPAHCK